MLGRWFERVRVLDNQVVESVVCVIIDNCKQRWLRTEGNVSNKHAEGEGKAFIDYLIMYAQHIY